LEPIVTERGWLLLDMHFFLSSATKNVVPGVGEIVWNDVQYFRRCAGARQIHNRRTDHAKRNGDFEFFGEYDAG
jgi:hypothetical protein